MIDDFLKKIWPTILFIILLVGMAYFAYIPIEIFNIDYENFSQGMKILYTFCTDLVYMLVMFLIYRKTLGKDLKSYFKSFGKNFETSFKYYFIGLIIMVVSNLIITFIFTEANANNEDAVRGLIDLYPLYMIFSVSIYAPVIEELIFRKSIKDMVYSYGGDSQSKLGKNICKYFYIIISGLIFASLHVVGMVTSPFDYLYIISYMGLGCAFSALYAKTDNIFSSISMHCLHNTFAVIMYLIGSGM